MFSRPAVNSSNPDYAKAHDTPHVLAWDIQTVPNVSGYGAANGLEGKSDDEIRDAMSADFPSTSMLVGSARSLRLSSLRHKRRARLIWAVAAPPQHTQHAKLRYGVFSGIR